MSHKRNGKDTRRHRARVLDEQGGICKFCRDPLTLESSTLEHIDPVALIKKEGRIGIFSWRLAATCRDCNITRNLLPVEQFIAIIASEMRPNQDQYVAAWERRQRNASLIDEALASVCGQPDLSTG